ncbi:30S ribosomal protein S5 [Candidatus Woesearchaeota archaeon]|nr:30S ribosomal protein S5 [Candidatus Woesearchaeota archaeon]MBT4387736.1 30S ribosomal protein S5 [Candidatus Woesearchaeota archaeon]MBT4595555.1 30S ribosomal protein S5 [Candidatus Woesearchaeota archaeon]MBT5740962.1 30S ribosomal protein S5 [Candidatus Woesearchaeota archaeon]MBT6505779.1 30S ribosomal protein S5 [Candidatus Woesearchaeota archaeon]
MVYQERQTREEKLKKESEEKLLNWVPKTELGKLVKEGKITDIDQIFSLRYKIKEPEILDYLCPNSTLELLNIGQVKGKFGGGKRRTFRQTQKKTKEGNKPSFSTYAVFGNENGYVGLGYGKSRETIPAREKAYRNAKINLIKIRRGSGSWEDDSIEPHSIPFKISGQCSSVHVELLPAPLGTGLVCHKEVAKVLKAAGIKNIRSNIRGNSSSAINLLKALEKALMMLTKTKINESHIEKLGIVDGIIK